MLTVGFRRVDSASGFFSDAVPTSAICLRGFSAGVGEVNYQDVTLKEVLRGLVELAPGASATSASVHTSASRRDELAVEAGKLTQAAFWAVMQDFVCEGDVIIAEDGTSSAGAGARSPPTGCTFITQAIWGSIGYSLGCLPGTLIAAPERRHLLFIGDDSFQLTAQELSTMLRHDLKPIIFLINLGFQRRPKRFHRGVVVAVACPAHARLRAALTKQRAVGLTDAFVNSLGGALQANTSSLYLLVNGGGVENVQTVLNTSGGPLS